MGSESSSLQTEKDAEKVNPSLEEEMHIRFFMPDEKCFTTDEVRAWYKGFTSYAPDGKANPSQFKQVYTQYFPFGDATQFSSHVFRVFDTNGDGVVDFREFISAMALTLHGTIDERVKWAFSVYDIDGNGEITRKEMLSILVAIGKMVGNSVQWPSDERTPYARLEKLFKILDTNNDSLISLKELTDAAHKVPYIAKLFSYGDHNSSSVITKKKR